MQITVSQRIKILRKEALEGQQDVATAIGVSKMAISAIERGGGVSPENLKKLSEHFRVNTQWITSGTGKCYKDNRPDPILPSETVADPWRDEAYENMKSERDRLREQSGRGEAPP